MITITTSTIIAMVIGFGIPALTAVVTKEALPKPVKVLILLFLSTATGVLTSVIGSPPANASGWGHLVLNIFLTFAVAASSDVGVWEKSGADAAIHRKTDRLIGIGKSNAKHAA